MHLQLSLGHRWNMLRMPAAQSDLDFNERIILGEIWATRPVFEKDSLSSELKLLCVRDTESCKIN